MRLSAWRSSAVSVSGKNVIARPRQHLPLSRRFHKTPLAVPSSSWTCARVRFASTARTATEDGRSIVTRLKNWLLGTAIGLSLVLGYVYVTDTRASFHVVAPYLLRWVYEDAEEAHEAGTRALKVLRSFGLHPRERDNPDEAGDLAVEVFGHTLSNPIGTSAGIDKHAEIPDALMALGPSIVEVGGTTPDPQDGNPKPRVFRLPSQRALINRYGLNSEGADHVAMRLRQRVREYAYSMGFGVDDEAERMVLDGEAGVPPGSLTAGKLMAVQVAKNKITPDDDIEAVKRDYVYCVEALARYADIIVVNVSSPNTPGLRGLQRVEPLTNILTGVVAAAQKADRKSKPAVMVKVSPDEDSEEQIRGICHAVWESGVDGLICGNTTTRRPDPFPVGSSLPPKEAMVLLEQGGYSGPQLFERTVALTKRYRKILDEGLEQASNTSSSNTPNTPSQEAPEPSDELASQIQQTVSRDAPRLKPSTSSSETFSQEQPLLRLPERHNPLTTTASTKSPTLASTPPSQSSQPPPEIPPPPSTKNRERKIIFATGGITTGAQALEVLDAGASVAQVYTAVVYGGVGTVGRMKGEMRREMERRGG